MGSAGVNTSGCNRQARGPLRGTDIDTQEPPECRYVPLQDRAGSPTSVGTGDSL
jgi:hypothetical protein